MVGLVVGMASRVGAEEKVPVESIREWIAQLGADQFAQREAASRRLSAAGSGALPLLAEAARGADLEVASRAVEIIRGHLDRPPVAFDLADRDGAADPAGVLPADGELGGRGNGAAGDDLPAARTADGDMMAAEEAERLLETLAEGEPGPVAQFASTSLEFHQLGMHEAARERLESLGAKVGDGFFDSGRRGLGVVIDSRWQGTIEDFRLLTRLRNLRTVGVHGIRLDERTLGVLGRLRGVESIHLYGTGVSDEAVAALAARFPAAEIDVRKGGKLGVGGQRLIGPCQITQVMAGSAADRAGLQIGDVVLTMNGEAVKTFEALTDFIGRHGPGDSIEVEIERGVAGKVPQRFTRTVTLDGWD